MRLSLLFLLICCTVPGFAQDDEQEKKFRERAAALKQDSIPEYGWKHTMATGLNLSQVSFKDWAAGGENALAYTLWLNGSSTQDMETTNWTNAYKFAFGQTKLQNQGVRKTNDELYLETLLIYKIWTYINPYVSATLRSQFAKGFEYDALGNKTTVSKFFDPAYLTQSVGAAYKPLPEVVTRLGVGVREVLTSQFTAYADDPATLEIEKTKISGGFESVTDVDWKFAENMQFTSKLEIFAPFKTLDEIIVRNDNTILAKVNSYVNASFNIVLINDPTVTRRTQIKQLLAVGVSYTLL